MKAGSDREMSGMKTIVQINVYRVQVDNPEFLLFRRTNKGDSFWQPISEEVRDSETVADTLKRALDTQASIGITDLGFMHLSSEMYTYEWYAHGQQGRDIVFAAEVEATVEIVAKAGIASKDEVSQFAWLSYDDAIQNLKWNGNKEALRRLRNHVTDDIHSGAYAQRLKQTQARQTAQKAERQAKLQTKQEMEREMERQTTQLEIQQAEHQTETKQTAMTIHPSLEQTPAQLLQPQFIQTQPPIPPGYDNPYAAITSQQTPIPDLTNPFGMRPTPVAAPGYFVPSMPANFQNPAYPAAPVVIPLPVYTGPGATLPTDEIPTNLPIQQTFPAGYQTNYGPDTYRQ